MPGQTPYLLQVLAVPAFFFGLGIVYASVVRFGSDSETMLRALFSAQAVLLVLLRWAAGVVHTVIPMGLRTVTKTQRRMVER